MGSPHDLIDPNKLFPNTLRFLENSILEFLQSLFSTFPAQAKESWHYDLDANLSEILIEGRSTDNLTTVDTRPKIVVSRGPVGWQNRSIGNFVGSRNLSLQSRSYTDIQDATIGVSCFSRNDLESDDIANIVFDSIKMFRTVLQMFGYLTIQAAQVGQKGLVKSDAIPNLWVTPVLVKAQVTKNWSVSVVDPVKLRKAIISVVVGSPTK